MDANTAVHRPASMGAALEVAAVVVVEAVDAHVKYNTQAMKTALEVVAVAVVIVAAH